MGGGVGGVWPVYGGVQKVGGQPFSAKRVGRGTSFFSEGGKYIDILGNFKHFEAQKMLKCFKIAPNSLLGLF
jgi:hypothetical protein